MHEFKRGDLKSGPGGKGGKVKSRKQAIAIGLSEARDKGAEVPKRKTAKKGTKKTVRKSTSRTRKSATKKSASGKRGPKSGSKRK